jgi:hypothetical protein
MARLAPSKEPSFDELLRCITLLPQLLDALRDQQRQIAGLKEQILQIKVGDSNSGGWVDAKGAAQYLSISDSTFEKYRYKTTPSVKGYPLDGKVLYKKNELDTFVKLYAIKSNGLA